MTELMIRPELADNVEPIDAVTPYPGNARRGDIPKIKRSLLKHGQYKEILVQASTGYILIGNNTYAAMRELGYEQVAVKRLDVGEAKAKEMLLVDNASSDEAIYDEAALAALLADVEDWDASGFDPDDLDDLLLKLQDEGDPEKLAAALPPAVAAQAPQTVPSVPATDARYAEAPEDEAKRQEKFDGWKPRYAKGLTEVILVYPEDRRDELLKLIEAAKPRFPGSPRNGDIVLGAVRLLTEVLAAVGRGDLAVDVERAMEVATPPADDPATADQAAVAEDQAQRATDTGEDADADGVDVTPGA